MTDSAPLTDDEKNLLRQAICDGQVVNTNQGQRPNPIKPEDLATIGALSPDQVRNKLIVYRAQKLSMLQGALTQATAKNTAIQTQLDSLNAIAIGTPST